MFYVLFQVIVLVCVVILSIIFGWWLIFRTFLINFPFIQDLLFPKPTAQPIPGKYTYNRIKRVA